MPKGSVIVKERKKETERWDLSSPALSLVRLSDEDGEMRREGEGKSYRIPEMSLSLLSFFSPETETLDSFFSRFFRHVYPVSFPPPPGLYCVLVSTEAEHRMLKLPRGSVVILDGKRKPIEKESALLMGRRGEFHLTEYLEKSPLAQRARWSFPVFQLIYKLHR